MTTLLVLVFLAFLWAIITCVGHASWLAFEFLFTGPKSPPKPSGTPQDLKRDLEATDRVLTRLLGTGLLEPETAIKVRTQLSSLAQLQGLVKKPRRSPATREVSQQPSSSSSRSHARPTPSASVPVKSPRTAPPGALEPKRPTEVSPTEISPTSRRQRENATNATNASGATITQTSASDLPPKEIPARENPSSRIIPPSEPALSSSEIIRSFLAAHNIRWGELVAGLMIVVCSIGLVVSLWNTLVSAHRVVPSIIFLAANTAIFGAGLYTLSRWKLRHTSRAMLVIATLLVPLGILAGLARAATDAEAVPLGDPVTLISIMIVGVAYCTLLWMGGKALVRRRAAGPLCLSVAGPAAMLPLVPEMIRHFGTSVYWTIAGGSTGLSIALVWLVRGAFRTKSVALGAASARHRVLTIGLGCFSLAALVGNILYLSEPSPQRLLSIAIALIPALCAIAATAQTLVSMDRRPKLALAGSVVSFTAFGTLAAILPAALATPQWLWLWAAAASVSLLTVGHALRVRQMIPLSALPVGITTVLTASTWTEGLNWDQLWLWQRMLGGQPMLAAFGVAATVASLSFLLRGESEKRTGYWIAGVFFAFGAINAMVLSVAPAAWLGIVPDWAVTVLLGAAGLGCALAPFFMSKSGSEKTFSIGETLGITALPLIVMTWCSILHPISIGQPLAPVKIWLATALAIATTLLFFAEALKKHHSAWLTNLWHGSVLISCTASFVLSAVLIHSQWAMACWSMFAIAALLLWGASLRRDAIWFWGAQLMTLVAAMVIGWGRFSVPLFHRVGWETAEASYGWSVLFASVAIGWILFREVSSGRSLILHLSSIFPSIQHRMVDQASIDRDRPQPSRPEKTLRRIENRVAWFRQPEIAPLRTMEVFAISAALMMLSIAVGQGFVSMLMEASGSSSLHFYAPVSLALLGFAASAGMLWIARRHILGAFSPMWMVCGVGGLIWTSNQIAVRTLTVPNEKLVLSATIAMLGCAVLAWATRQRTASTIAQFSTAILLISSSLVLLSSGWLVPILRQVRPDTFSTVTVAFWCTLGAIACGYFGNRLASRRYYLGSVVLTAAATLLIMPLVENKAVVSWFQWSTVAVFCWAGLSTWVFPSKTEAMVVARGAMGFAVVIGVVSGIVTTGWTLVGFAGVDVFAKSGSMTLVGLTSVFLLMPAFTKHLGGLGEGNRISWPIVLSLFAGNVSILLAHFDWVELPLGRLLIVVWGVAMIGSIARYIVKSSVPVVEWGHSVVMSVVLVVIAMTRSGVTFYDWVGFVAACCSGIMVTSLAWKLGTGESTPNSSYQESNALHFALGSRLLGWFMLATGGYFLMELCSASILSDWERWTIVLAWLGAWILVWRMTAPDAQDTEERSWLPLATRVLPDTEVTLVFTLALLGELIVSVVLSDSVARLPGWQSPWLLVRLLFAVAIVATTVFRARRTTAWFGGAAIACLGISILSVRIADARGAEMISASTIAILSGTAVLTMMAFAAKSLALGSGWAVSKWVRSIVGWTSRKFQADASHSCSVQATAGGIWFAVVAGSLATFATCLAVAISDNSQHLLPLMIGGIGLLAIAAAELSGIGRGATQEHRRRAAIVLAFLATFLLAGAGVVDTHFPSLTLTMRWFVAAVCTVGVFAFALPKMLGETQARLWSPSFRGGLAAAGLVAVVTLGLILGQEVMIRTGGDPSQISKPLVLGVGGTLAILSLLTTLGALFSGPQSSYQKQWQLSDATRRALVVLAQVFGGLTWFHLFLCKNPIATLGLRAYWPYIVMSLAFVSVAITQWANRRGDQLIAGTMKQTSLYLPLVPVLGFWLSLSVFDVGAESEATRAAWTYIRGKVSYQSLLILGTLYYAGTSLLWKNGISRVATVILGNAALWVLLAQTPNWEFLSHPQAWMIPPAASLLVVAHLHRERLGKEASSAIRYAATLVIYISSTADMLLTGIGSTLAGPIILVALALAGMAAGVILRVKPFLYLGAIFVFFGVTSMVWHAQRSMDEVWPWWAFGISTGLLLLAGLMAIEKNKPKLQAMATRLSTWEA